MLKHLFRMSKHCVNKQPVWETIIGNSMLMHLYNRNRLGQIQSGFLPRDMRYLIIEITLLWM